MNRIEQNKVRQALLLNEPRRGELSEPRSGEREVRVRVAKLSSNLFVSVHTEGFLSQKCGRVGTATYRKERRIAQIVIVCEFLVELKENKS